MGAESSIEAKGIDTKRISGNQLANYMRIEASKAQTAVSSMVFCASMVKFIDKELEYIALEQKKPVVANINLLLEGPKEKMLRAKQEFSQALDYIYREGDGLTAEQMQVYLKKETSHARELLAEARMGIDSYEKEKYQRSGEKELSRAAISALPGGQYADAVDMVKQIAEEYYKNGSISYINVVLLAATIVPAGGKVLKEIHDVKVLAAAQKMFKTAPSQKILKEADDFVNAVSKTKVTDDLKLVRSSLEYSEVSVWALFGKMSSEASNLLTKYSHLRTIAAEKKYVYNLDKSLTWMLNNINQKVGDLGLEIYFKGAAKLEKEGHSVIRLTEKGDEILIFSKDPKLIPKIEKMMRETAEEVFKEKGLKDTLGLKDVCAKFSAQQAELFIKGDNILYKVGNVEKPFSLGGIINNMELQHSLKNASLKTRTAVYDFLDAAKSTHELEKATVDTFTSIKAVIQIEDPKLLESFREIARENGKAVHHVSTNTFGPSFFNQLGHANADNITTKVFDELVTKGKISARDAGTFLQKGALNYGTADPSIYDLLRKMDGTTMNMSIGKYKVAVKLFAGTAEEVTEASSKYLLARIGASDEIISEIIKRKEQLDMGVALLRAEGAQLPPYVRDSIAMLEHYTLH